MGPPTSLIADFVSASTLEAGLPLPVDALGHGALAERVLEKAVHLPPGSVIAVQGGWGRGKTDVLARLVSAARAGTAAAPAGSCEWLWINPWQYGTPDLLSPLVLALLEKIPPAERVSGQAALKKAARSVILAGLSFGLKATAAAAIPGAALLNVAEGPAGKLLEGLFDAQDAQKPAGDPPPDPDPVAAMGARFAELVAALLPPDRQARGHRLLVCVDDLDRCLPDRQVALLEAIRFLTSAGAAATFLIALDPALARQAIHTHYRSQVFDPDRYLDKLFHLRINLPELGAAHAGELIRSQLQRQVWYDRRSVPLSAVVTAVLGPDWADHLIDQAQYALGSPLMRNPRLVHRMMDRLYLLLSTGGELKMQQAEEFRWLLCWLGIIERWPELRAALQSNSTEFQRNLQFIAQQVTSRSVSEFDSGPFPHPLNTLPKPAPDMQLLLQAIQHNQAWAFLQRIDGALIAAGL